VSERLSGAELLAAGLSYNSQVGKTGLCLVWGWISKSFGHRWDSRVPLLWM